MWLLTNTWTAPSRILAVDASGATRDTGLRNSALPSGTPELEVSEVEVPSHDGVGVPLAILRRKGLALDGRNPTLLVGYGADGFSFDACFDPRSVAYPAVMLIHGLNDPRVDVWHSAKAAARLQAASTSGSTAQELDNKMGDLYSFLLWQLGKSEAKP